MGLLSKALAVGVGYVLAQPEVRQKIVAVVQHPKVKQRRDQARDLANNGLQTAQDQLRRASTTERAGPPVSTGTASYRRPYAVGVTPCVESRGVAGGRSPTGAGRGRAAELKDS